MRRCPRESPRRAQPVPLKCFLNQTPSVSNRAVYVGQKTRQLRTVIAAKSSYNRYSPPLPPASSRPRRGHPTARCTGQYAHVVRANAFPHYCRSRDSVCYSLLRAPRDSTLIISKPSDIPGFSDVLSPWAWERVPYYDIHTIDEPSVCILFKKTYYCTTTVDGVSTLKLGMKQSKTSNHAVRGLARFSTLTHAAIEVPTCLF